MIIDGSNVHVEAVLVLAARYRRAPVVLLEEDPGDKRIKELRELK